MRKKLLSCLILPLCVSSMAHSGTAGYWSDINTGSYHVLALKEDGTVWGWGNNNLRQLLGERGVNFDYPKQISSQTNWQSLSSGSYSSYLINSSGEAYAAGVNSRGTLGVGHINDVTELTIVASGFRKNVDAVEEEPAWTSTGPQLWRNISANSLLAIGLTTGGDWYAWGDNGAMTIDSDLPSSIISSPHLIEKTKDKEWSEIGLGTNFFAGLSSDGKIFTWGNNDQNQLGRGTVADLATPGEVLHPENKSWLTMRAGFEGVLAVDSERKVWFWGQMLNGPRGATPQPLLVDGEQVQYSLNTLVADIKDRLIIGENNNAIITDNGNIYIWGFNDYNLVDPLPYDLVTEPTLVKRPDRTPVVAQEAKLTISSLIIRTNSGEILAYGRNLNGELGIDSLGVELQKQVVHPTAGHTWHKAAAGQNHSLAITFGTKCKTAGDICPSGVSEDTVIGELWGWGDNSENQLSSYLVDPNPNTVVIDYPTILSPKRDWIDVVSNANHSFAIDVNGNLYAWGDNTFGQLGDGSKADKTKFTKIEHPTDSELRWRSISTSESHTLAIDSDGKLWAWGQNDQGQLGVGSTTESLEPQLVSNLTHWQEVAAGNGFSFATTTSGQRYAWGTQSRGALGNAVADNELIVTAPELVVDSIEQWGSIEAGSGSGYAIGIENNETNLYVWGANQDLSYNAELSTWEKSDASTPVQLPAQDNELAANSLSFGAKIFSSATSHFVISQDGDLYSWGRGDSGQLGHGDLLDLNVPKAVEPSISWAQVSAGTNHTVGITREGRLFTWGANAYNQLGFNTHISKPYRDIPTRVRLYDFDGDGAPDNIDAFPKDGRYIRDVDGDGTPDLNDDDS
ncbi:RCC1 domain-containing protein [Pseudoalteromonas sp. GB56]